MNTHNTYNGYKNWNEWNIVLWINNDEYIYKQAVDLVQKYGIKKTADIFWKHYKGEKTPDGARYTLSAIRAALQGMDE